VRDAIYDRLRAFGALTALLSDPDEIHHQVGPPEAEPPFIVFDRVAERWRHQFKRGRVTRELWLVKAVDLNSSASDAEDIAKVIDDALDGVTLSLSTGDKAYVRHETGVAYPETVGSDRWQHHGAIYRVVDP
jgi:hypothetical protein